MFKVDQLELLVLQGFTVAIAEELLSSCYKSSQSTNAQ